MSNEIVNYHNTLSKLALKNFNANELDIFMSLLNKVKDKGSNIISLPFKDIIRLANYKDKNKNQFVRDIQTTYDKLLKLNIKLEYDNKITSFVLFTKYVIDKENETLELKVNDEFLFIINNLYSNFTKFELKQFTQLKSVYAKSCYRQLKRFRSTGYWKVSIEEFRELMDIPKSYKTHHINDRVISAINKELPKYFKYLTIEKEYGKGSGKPIKAYTFYWEPENINFYNDEGKKCIDERKNKERKSYRETGLICKKCGEPLVEKIINNSNCWCHIDGWKSNAKCKAIYNTIAEIQDFQEFSKRN